MSDFERGVEDAFSVTADGLAHWPDPHPDRPPLDEEYSRVLDPQKWRIVPARAEAWSSVAAELGIATLERDVDVRWAEDTGAAYRRVDRLIPHEPGGLTLVLAYAGPEGDEPTAVTIAIGEPAVVVGMSPACGCDACDSGSQNELDDLDQQIRVIVSGHIRHLRAGDRTIISFGPRGWSATGSFRRTEIGRTIENPKGWVEVSGSSWITAGPS